MAATAERAFWDALGSGGCRICQVQGLGSDVQGLARARRGVAATAERAFWDALGDGLRAAPPQWERLVVLLGDAREALAALIPPSPPEGAHLLRQLADKLDTVRRGAATVGVAMGAGAAGSRRSSTEHEGARLLVLEIYS